MHDDTNNAVDMAVGLAEFFVSDKLVAAGICGAVVSSLLLWCGMGGSSVFNLELLPSCCPSSRDPVPSLDEGMSSLARVRIVRCCAMVVRAQ